MNKGVKRYLMGMMSAGGHRHASMTDTLLCGTCGTRMKKAEAEYDRLRRQSPELFVKEAPKPQVSDKIHRMDELYQHRLKKDEKYREHIKKMFTGSPKERKREQLKEDTGYYERG